MPRDRRCRPPRANAWVRLPLPLDAREPDGAPALPTGSCSHDQVNVHIKSGWARPGLPVRRLGPRRLRLCGMDGGPVGHRLVVGRDRRRPGVAAHRKDLPPRDWARQASRRLAPALGDPSRVPRAHRRRASGTGLGRHCRPPNVEGLWLAGHQLDRRFRAGERRDHGHRTRDRLHPDAGVLLGVGPSGATVCDAELRRLHSPHRRLGVRYDRARVGAPATRALAQPCCCRRSCEAGREDPEPGGRESLARAGPLRGDHESRAPRSETGNQDGVGAERPA